MPRVPELTANIADNREEFSGGLNETDKPKTLKINEFAITKNIFPRVNIIQFAKGKDKLSVTANIDLAALNVFVGSDGVDRVVYLEGKDIKLLQIDPDSASIIGSLISTANAAQFKQKENTMILASNVNNIEMQNGTTSLFIFTVSGITTAPAVADTYTHPTSGTVYTVSLVELISGVGTITLERTTGTTNPLPSGDLTRTSGAGDATITFTRVVSGFDIRNLSPITPLVFEAAQFTEVNLGSGNLDSGEKYQYAFTRVVVDSDGNLIKESGLSPIPSITLVDDSDVEISFIKYTDDPQINKFNIYRTLGGTTSEPTTDLFFLKQINNATQIFTDTTSDSILSVETDLADTKGFLALPASEHLEIIQERIYVVDKSFPNKLIYSHNIRGKFSFIFAEAGENLVTTTNNIISVSGFSITPNGQPINKIKKHGNDLYVFTNGRTYIIRDNRPEDGMRDIPETLGGRSKFGAIEKDGRLLVNTYEVERRGIRFIDGLEYSRDLTNEQLETTFGSIVDFSKIVMLETGNNMWLLYNDDTTKNFNNKALVLQFHKEQLLSWTIMTNVFGDVAITDSNDRIIAYNNNDNTFYILNDAFTNGEEITAEFSIAPIKGKSASEQVELNQVLIYGKNLDSLLMRAIADDGVFADISFVRVDAENSNWLEANNNETDNDTDVEADIPDAQLFEGQFTTESFGHVIVPEFKLTYKDIEPEIYSIEFDHDIRRFR